MMSMNFEKPLDEKTLKEVRKRMGGLFGKPVASDEQTFLYDKMAPITGKQGGGIARAAKQPATMEFNEIGTTKVVRGVAYILTEEGWEEQQFPS